MGQRRNASQWDGLCVSSIPPGCLQQGAGGAFFLCQNPGCFPGLPRAAVLSSDGAPERKRGPLPEGLFPPSFSPTSDLRATSNNFPIPKYPSPSASLSLCPGVPSTLAVLSSSACHTTSNTEMAPQGSPWRGAIHNPWWTAVSSCLRGLPCSWQSPLMEGLCLVPPVRPFCHAQCLLLVTAQDTHSGHLHATVQRSVPDCPGRRRKGQAEKLQRHKSGFKFQLGT